MIRALPLALVTCLVSAGSLRAEVLLAPFVGASFGGDTDDAKITFGGIATFRGGDAVLGFALDVGHAPDFLGTTGFGNNSLTSLMGNVVLMSPGEIRPYASAGLGLVKLRVNDLSGLLRVDSNEFGFNVGGGLLLGLGASVGLQVEVRYFRNLTDPEPDAEFDLDVGGLDFWRAVGGVVFRF
jgi:opacity protein-like surface antigen